jgi:hypothetical protein
MGAYVPAGQYCLTAPVHMYPAGQTVQLMLPTIEYVPAPQVVAGAVGSGHARPAAQGTHDTRAASLFVPLGQSRHDVEANVLT